MTVVPRWVSVVTTAAILACTAAFAAVDVAAGMFTVASGIAFAVLVGAFTGCTMAGGTPQLDLPHTALATTAGVLLPLLGFAEMPAAPGSGVGVWVVTGTLCPAVLLLWGRRPVAAWSVVGLLAVITCWRFGLAALNLRLGEVILFLGVATAAGWAIQRTQRDLAHSVAHRKGALAFRAARDAYHREREVRLATTTVLSSTMLQRIVDAGGDLEPADRAECRVLEQTIRDEIRGRNLLNDAVREQVMQHRRRGAVVQVNDDGGLEGLDPTAVDAMLHRVADSIADLRSDRLIIRTNAKESATAITVVAMSTDPIAAALGIDDGDDQVDLWLEIPRPVAVGGSRVP